MKLTVCSSNIGARHAECNQTFLVFDISNILENHRIPLEWAEKPDSASYLLYEFCGLYEATRLSLPLGAVTHKKRKAAFSDDE